RVESIAAAPEPRDQPNALPSVATMSTTRAVADPGQPVV
ncbi:MAG: hypothetical protein QOD78_1204, partial [Chloroflexota bacterium]|nr:hypothetical protein [Chloroflexota bacterium]